jgi:hypothetical protein
MKTREQFRKSREEMFIDIFCKKSEQRKNCKWWQFRKKAKLEKEMNSALELAHKYTDEIFDTNLYKNQR